MTHSDEMTTSISCKIIVERDSSDLPATRNKDRLDMTNIADALVTLDAWNAWNHFFRQTFQQAEAVRLGNFRQWSILTTSVQHQAGKLRVELHLVPPEFMPPVAVPQ